MSMVFRRPIGAVKDVKELEYIAALHQTKDDGDFMDGSIDAADVKAFLMSRYGIDIHKEDVRKIIFKGLAGGEGEDSCIDIVETVSILIIPLLVKVSNRLQNGNKQGGAEAEEDDRFKEDCAPDDDAQRLEPPPNIIEDVLKCILMDTSHINAGASNGNDTKKVLDNPPKLTPLLLKAIFIEFDEFDLLEEDDLIDQMIADATGGKEDAVLDVETFARGLTSDVQLYNTESETQHSTILSDVFPDGFTNVTTDMKLEANEEEPWIKGDEEFEIKRVFNFSQLDFTADNVVSSLPVVLMWLLIVFSYVFYVYSAGSEFDVCDSTGFGCKMANAILRWLQIMVKLVVGGLLVGCGLSMGNGEFDRNIWAPIIGILSVGLFVIFPALYTKIDTFIFATDTEYMGSPQNAKFILVAFGVLLIILQIRNLCAMFPFSQRLMTTKSFIGDFLLGSAGKGSYLSKQAAIYKINEMVRNAYELHKNVSVEKAGGEDAEENDQMKNRFLTKIFKNKEDKEQRVEAEAASLTAQMNQAANKTAKEEAKRINHSRKRDKSTKERALENYSNIMDETEVVGGAFWAWKGYLSNDLQKTEGIWLSSRLIAACAIQFVAAALLFAVNIYIFVVTIDALYPDLTIDYSATCFSEFDYDKCYFPFGDGFYTGIGICADVTLQSSECLELFEVLPIDSTLLERSCDTIDTAYQALETITPGNVTCDEAFVELSDLFASNSTIESLDGYELIIEEYTFCYNYIADYNVTLGVEGKNETLYNETLYQECTALGQMIDNLTRPILLDNNATLTDAVDFCLVLYPYANVDSLCDRTLWRSKEAITTYEIKHEKNGICSSVLNICSPTTSNIQRATCVIGERNFQAFQFEGAGCRSYTEINETLNFYDNNVKPYLNQIADIYPKKWEVRVTAAFAIIASTLVSLATAFVYIPSAIHTIMQFRSGVIPSLRDRNFLRYRAGLYNMTYLIGVMFWGLCVTTIVSTFAVALGVFLFMWHISRDYLLTFAAQVVGIVLTLLIKIGVCTVFFKVAYVGFYRKYPAAANIFGFALECWYLALTVAFILTRLIKFLVATGLYVGRIDRPVLAEGLLLDIDNLPRVFRQNLLSTDAHRHPYIELLGLMYLMKLRHKDKFGTGSGTAWRLLFVIALMPWLKKKRIEDKGDDEDGDKRYNIGVLVDEIFAGIVATS